MFFEFFTVNPQSYTNLNRNNDKKQSMYLKQYKANN